jgi:hypothetical protein
VSGELVERLMVDHTSLMEFLREGQEISFLTTVESSLPKVVLLASASDLEESMQKVLVDYFHGVTKSSDFAVSFVQNKAVKRQYHTYFDWERRSANKFFALFGARFKTKVKIASAEDVALAEAIASFCEIGDLRNQLVHQNYAAFTVEKTAAEVFQLYQSALYFVGRLPGLLQDTEEED